MPTSSALQMTFLAAVYGAGKVAHLPGAHRSTRIEQILGTLTDDERATVELRYGLYEDEATHTVEEVCHILQTTRERVRDLEATAMQKLRGQADAPQ